MSWLLDKCWEHTKKLEGGFTVDEGGATKFGICWKYDSEYLIEIGIDSEDKVKNLTEPQAKEIFRKKYLEKWHFIELAELPDTCCAALDMAFHEGKYGWMAVQMVCNKFVHTDLAIDGAFGPKTKSAVQQLIAYSKKGVDASLNDLSLSKHINACRFIFYAEIWRQEKASDDLRATRKYNSALRRL